MAPLGDAMPIRAQLIQAVITKALVAAGVSTASMGAAGSLLAADEWLNLNVETLTVPAAVGLLLVIARFGFKALTDLSHTLAEANKEADMRADKAEAREAATRQELEVERDRCRALLDENARLQSWAVRNGYAEGEA